MEGAFAWLNKIVDAILTLFPRILILKPTHEAVDFIFGKHIRKLTCGWHIWWPLISELEVYPVVRQTLNLPQQTITTLDDEQIQISTIVVFEIFDIVKALTLQYDLEETIKDLSQGNVRLTLSKNEYSSIMKKVDTIDKQLARSLDKELSAYGIKIVKVCLTDCVRTQTYTIASLGGLAGRSAFTTEGESE